MRRQAGVLVLVAGATAALVTGGGLAWAGWTVGGGAAVATVESARIPVMNQPSAELAGNSAKISWTAIELSSGRPVGGYVVVRRDGADSAVACTTAASETRCRDRAAEPGSTVTYVVHATVGANWVGEDSRPSDPVRLPDRANVAGAGHKTGGADQDPATTETGKIEQEKGSKVAAEPTPTSTTDPAPSESVSHAASPSGSESPAARGAAGGL
jgi:hypothetical protein